MDSLCEGGGEGLAAGAAGRCFTLGGATGELDLNVDTSLSFSSTCLRYGIGLAGGGAPGFFRGLGTGTPAGAAGGDGDDNVGEGWGGGCSLRESGFGASGGLFSILTLFFC